MVCKTKLSIKKTELSEVFLLAPRLRQDDKEEVEAQGLTPLEGLLQGFQYSEECNSAIIDGKVEGLFGISSFNLPQGFKAMWFLGSSECEKYPIAFVKWGRRLINKILDDNCNVFNMVYAGNVNHIKYLERIGLTIDYDKPFITKQGYAFYCFYKMRE